MTKPKILLTGASGFLGSYVLENLVNNSYPVTVLKRSSSDLARIKHLVPFAKFYDIDKVKIDNTFDNENIDIIIHTACCYGRQNESDQNIFDTNVLFGKELLETAIRNKVKLFINTGTFLARDINTYSLTKNKFSEWLKTKSNEIKIINIKPDYIFGPKDDETKFLPWLLAQFENNVKRIPLTDGSQYRDFIYIDDVVSAYMILISKFSCLPNYTDIELGTGTSVSLRSFIQLVHKIYNSKFSTTSILGFGDLESRPFEQKEIYVDIHVLKKLGWKKKNSLKESLEKIIHNR